MTVSSAPAPGPQDGGAVRCPACGSGDLCSIRIARPLGDVWRGVYCVGEYDRDRRRVVSRGCGYTGTALPESPTGDAIDPRNVPAGP